MLTRQLDWTIATHLLNAGAKIFERGSHDREFSFSLLDITDVVIAQNDVDWKMLPGETFASILRKHFPNAHSIASLGREDFRILVRDDDNCDVVPAIEHVCAEAREAIYPDPKFDAFTPVAGRIKYDNLEYDCIVDMLQEADEIFSDVKRIQPWISL